MRKWAMVLHFYQPPTQDYRVTAEVAQRCYLPVLELIKEHKRARVTVNVNASLMVQLRQLGVEEFFEDLKELVKSGRVEVLQTPMYHPVIPLTPEEIWKWQVERNKLVLKDYMGIEPGVGFYPPELAVEESSLKKIGAQKRVEYVVVDETALGEGEKLRRGVVKWGELNLLVSDRLICDAMRAFPKRLSAERLSGWVERAYAGGELVASVHDVELFGHHYEERMEVLGELFSQGRFEFVTGAEAVEEYKQKAETVTQVRPASWQWEKGFDLWSDPKNKLQQRYLKLARRAWRAWKRENQKLEGHFRDSAEDHLDQGWSSCNLYWLSNRPWWHPELVERGAGNLIKCVRSLPLTKGEKVGLEKEYFLFLTAMWRYHWSGKQALGFKEYEESRMVYLSDISRKLGIDLSH